MKMEIRNNEIVSSAGREAVTHSGSANKIRSAAKLASMALITAASAYGCMLDSKGNGEQLFDPNKCDGPFACNDGGVAGAAGSDSGLVPPPEAGPDGDAQTPDSAGGTGGTAGESGAGGMGGVAGSPDAGDSAAGSAGSGGLDGGNDADTGTGGTAGVAGSAGSGGGPVSCMSSYDANSAAAVEVTVNANPDICSKVYKLDSNKNVESGPNDTSCQSGTVVLPDVGNGQYVAVFSKFWQSVAAPTVAMEVGGKPITAISVGCLEINLLPNETVNWGQAQDAIANVTLVDGYCSGSATYPVLLSDNVTCPEPYSTVHLVEFNKSN